MNNNLFTILTSMLNGNFAQNAQNFSQQPWQNNNTNLAQENWQNGQSSIMPNQKNFSQNWGQYAQSFPDEAYRQMENQQNNQNQFNPNMLSAILSMMGKNNDLSTFSSIFSAKKQENDETNHDNQKKSPPEDDDVII